VVREGVLSLLTWFSRDIIDIIDLIDDGLSTVGFCCSYYMAVCHVFCVRFYNK